MSSFRALVEECPRMKALQEFLAVGTHDSDRKWAEYVALAPDLAGFPNPKRGPAVDSSASSTTRPTASPRVVSSVAGLKRDATKDGLTPGAQHIYDYLVGRSATPATSTPTSALDTSLARSTGGAVSTTSPAAASSSSTSTHDYKPATKDDLTPGARRIYDFLVGSSPAPTSTVPPHDASSVVPIDGSSERAATTPSVTTAITKDELTPGARHISDHLVGGSSAPASTVSKVSSVPLAPSKLNVVQNKVTAIAATVPTTCSSECSCDDADASVSVDISSTTPDSPTTTCSTVPELAALVVNDKALDVIVTGDTAAICLPGDLADCTGNEDAVDMSLTPGSAPASFVTPQVFKAMVPHTCLIKCSVEDTCVLMPKFNSPLGCCFTIVQGNGIHSDCTLLPWPSFKCSSFWTLLVRQVLSEQREGFPSLVALHIRAMSLQRFQVPFVHHVRHKHDKVFLGVQQLRPWPPPNVEIMDVHTQEAACGWIHSLEIAGRILLHQLGKFLSSPSSITVKDTTSPCAKWCLDDLSWRLHKWWLITHCVQLANVIVQDYANWCLFDVLWKLSRWSSHTECARPFTTNKTRIERAPLPPPWSICIQFLPMTTILPLLVESVEYMRKGIEMRLCCFSSQVAEFTVILCSAAGSISNMIKHISGDRPLLTTVDIELNATLTVIVFALGVLSVQLQPTVFRWSYPSSYIHFLSTSTLDFLLVRRAVQITRNLCCLDNLLGSFGSYNWAFEEEKGQVLLSMPWLSFRCQRVASDLILLGKLPTGHSHEDPNNCAGNCLETEHLQQWRPPEHVTSFASMDILFLRFKGCLSDIHWAQSTITFLEDLHRHKQQTTRYLEVHNLLYRLTVNYFPTELFVTENWLIPWEPGNDSPGQNLMENFTSLLITCELLYSISVDDNFLADHYLLRCMRCVQADGVGAPLQANETLLFPWDPGDYSSSAWHQGKIGGVVDACPFPRTDASQLPWDPGYSSQVRLGGKPNF